MGQRIKRHDLEQALGRLVATEQQIRPLAERPRRLSRFRRVGFWLVDERYLITLLWARVRGRQCPTPPRLADVALRRLILALLFTPRVPVHARTQALFFGSHVRAFYPDLPQPLALKLVHPEASGRLQREVAVRTGVARQVPAPQLLKHSVDGSYPYLCEQLVFGHRPNRRRESHLVIAFVLGELWDMYMDSGIEWRRCADCHQLDKLLDEFDATLDAVTWHPHWPAKEVLRAALTRLGDEADKLIPCCLAHGDLADGNMLVAEGRVYLLDWEATRRLPLLHELVEILAHYPDSWAPITARIAEQFTDVPSPGMASLNTQAALAWLERMAQRANSRVIIVTAAEADPDPDTKHVLDVVSKFERRVAADVEHLARLLCAGAG